MNIIVIKRFLEHSSSWRIWILGMLNNKNYIFISPKNCIKFRAHVELRRPYTMEPFCGNSQCLYTLNYFAKKLYFRYWSFLSTPLKFYFIFHQMNKCFRSKLSTFKSKTEYILKPRLHLFIY